MKNLCIFCLFISNCSFGQITKLVAGNIKPGFISLTVFDTSRPRILEQPVTAKARIIQLNIWYPSAGDTRLMHFADSAGLVGKELDTSFANKNPEKTGIEKYFGWPASVGADRKDFIAFLDSKIPMKAFRNAKWVKQKYPLVMLVHGFAADYAYFAEYLAGNGYVVMQVPVKGTTQYELDFAERGLESQVRDYEFALEVLQKKFSFLFEKSAVVGFSFGGQSAVALALRNKHVKAIISLDGGIGSSFGAKLISAQRYYQAKGLTVPILHLYNPGDSYTDLSWFDSISHSTRFIAAMKNMQHGHFTSFGILNKIVPGIMGKVPDPGNGYESVMLLTKEFLNKVLKNKMTGTSNFFDMQIAAHPWIKECIEQTSVKLSS